MFVLGLQGSPRKKSNTDFLLSTFMAAARKKGAAVHTLEVCRMDIQACKELIVCEKKGYCPIDDDMMHTVYPLLRRADVVVAATPIFFYNATAQLKAVFDRSQTLWARKYRMKLKDPGRGTRRGFLLSVAATEGPNLFEGLHLTTKYFFDAIDAVYDGHLTYRKIEHRGDMKTHPTVVEDVDAAVDRLLKPFAGRQKMLFASVENTCRSQMAAAFARYLFGEKVEAVCGGRRPGARLDPVMAQAMAEEGIDMAYIQPLRVEDVLAGDPPALIVDMGDGKAGQNAEGLPVASWQLPHAAGLPLEEMRRVRDEVKTRVLGLLGD